MFTFETFRRFLLFCVLAVVVPSGALAQGSAAPQQPATDPYANGNAAQVASILRMSDLLNKLRTIRAQTACGSPASGEELAIRQDILEAVESSSLDLDSVGAGLGAVLIRNSLALTLGVSVAAVFVCSLGLTLSDRVRSTSMRRGDQL